MADIVSGCRAILAADVTVAALVGTRIYPDQLPAGVTYPAIHFEHADEESTFHMGGLSGYANSFMEIQCHAVSRAGATALADAVRLALSNFSGTSSGVVIDNIMPLRGTTGKEKPANKTDAPIYWHEREFHAWYAEATS